MRSLDSLLEPGSKVVSTLFMPKLDSSDAKTHRPKSFSLTGQVLDFH
ncbi:hypothetical protein PS938_05274 [Pseudomonas fluorescens]|uniref:Uncharacterized protein n=1 Tax=Pseudomonas fluorescens TaxID=294 RepID=A0A5E7VJ38_PSEFL|nr:hypothetical protein PS938_05274 [Pseudomonas fluorescens]